MIDNKLNSVTLFDILELIFSAEDFGYANDVLFASFAKWLDNKLSDEDIEEYGKTFLTQEAKDDGYTEEDYDNAISTLKKFRSDYCEDNI